MKSKLIPTKKNVYGPTSNQWAFVRKVRGGFKVLGAFQNCKDYTHDAICNAIHKEKCNNYTGYTSKAKICLDKLRLVMFFARTENIKKHVYGTKRAINSIEKKNGIKLTTITEVDSGYPKMHAFVITAHKTYIESPALMHGLIAFIRTMHCYEKNISYKNLTELVNGKQHKDSYILKFVTKYDIMGLLMRNHKQIFKGLSLKDIYPKEVNNPNASSYHGSFGMVALSTHRLGSKKYSERVCTLLKANKIPQQ